MATKVRRFNSPTSLAESLADPCPPSESPRSAPTAAVKADHKKESTSKEQTPRQTTPKPSDPYTRVPMDGESKRQGGVTFAAQDSLPKLPIPELSSTCQKYMDVLKPLQTARERVETQIAVKEFLAEDGPDLQEKLKNYAQGKTSYIEQFCKSAIWAYFSRQITNAGENRVRFLPQL